MLSIGELAQRTGVSRRMLRHWEEMALVVPSEVDSWTGHRRYALRQTGRVRAIAALRATGFSLDAIRDLLSSELSEERLVTILRLRETELLNQIAEASTGLNEVRTRLDSIEKGHHIIMNTLELSSLPELRFDGSSEDVADETEIPDAVQRLLASLGVSDDDGRTVVLSYDGNTDLDMITVSAGLIGGYEIGRQDLTSVVLPGSPTSASVTYASPPASVGDAWIALDAELEKYRLRTTGPYRQTMHPDGTVVLAAPTLPMDAC